MEKKYTINGKEYKSLEELPVDLREFFKDANNDGVPDIAEPAVAKARREGLRPGEEVYIEGVTINGKHYDSWEAVPEEYQSLKTEIEKGEQKESTFSRKFIVNSPDSPHRTSDFGSARKIDLRTIIFILFLVIFIFILLN